MSSWKPLYLLPGLCVVVSLMTPLSVLHAGDPAPAANGADASPDAGKIEAERYVMMGKNAMADSNNDPSRSVDAAVAFSKALKYYEKAGDTDKVCDLEANIFWCKKRMNIDDVKKFVASKNGDASVTAALDVAEKVATKTVSADEAKNYFSRAEKFAKENPTQYDQIQVRYFEVAQRFVGTETGVQAQRLSLDAQGKVREQFEAEKKAQRETLFSKPAQSATGQSPVPAPDALKSAISDLKKLYVDDYKRSKPNQKRNFAIKLIEQAQSTKDDPKLLYAMLSEASDLSMAGGDFYSVLQASDLIAANFSGVDAKVQKKAVLSRLRASPTPAAIVKLLDTPDDADANTVAGKYFCLEAKQWELGLPMLARGTDVDLKQVADMEMAKPQGASQQYELGSKWFELGKKGRSPGKESMLGRCLFWYKQAEPGLTGVSKNAVKTRMDEIDGLLPMTNLDYDNLTAKQWDRLKGTTVQISAGKDRNDTNLRLSKGQRLRVVPHPTETWTIDYFVEPITVGWHGYSRSYKSSDGTTYTYATFGDFAIGEMVMQIENGAWKKPGIIEGDGRLFLGPYSSGWGSGGHGIIRAKIIPVEDE